MLNYSVKVGEQNEETDAFAIAQDVGANPFPGLRPFTMDECHLFFGREGQVDDILLKLARHHCVTIMGYSGSGKSSLMNCGVVPVLLGGFMTHTSPHWAVIASRPGITPITNLTNSVVNFLVQSGRIDQRDLQIHQAIISSVLRSGPDGLVEVCRYIQAKDGENIFFLIDQFEEIFRFKDTGDTDFANDAALYVNILMNAVHQKEVPVYVSINMRSDFIGDCAVFPGLTQMINESNYLVPQMTREQKKMAIEGPIAVGGGKISGRLLKRLLSDLGDNQDQLPILQHAMMRTWDYWIANREPGEPLDIRHYNAVGKISQALSLHANEAFDELTSREKEIAEVLFKSLTEKNNESQGLRRPAKLKTIAELAEASEAEVIKVIDEFRKPGRSFLMPGIHVPLNSNTTVEISHESLMRIWTRLNAWVDEEFDSAQMYKRISEAAAMYQIGKTGLWRPPDLQLALNWQKKQRPTRTWAQRYDEAFERAIVFLDTSRITYEAELKNQEMLQQRMLRRARVTNAILVVFLIIAIAMFFYGLVRQFEAEHQADLAKAATLEAVKQEEKATAAAKLAEEKKQEVERQAEQLIQKQKELEVALIDARLARDEAQANLKLAQEQTAIAERETDNANVARADALKQYERAQKALDENNRLYYLSIAQSMEAKSRTMDDKELAGLLAMQGYLFHTRYGGARYDPYVFSGLYYAVAKQNGDNYNEIRVPGKIKNRIFSLSMSKKSNSFYATGNDGRVIQGNVDNQSAGNIIAANPYPNRVVALSNDEQYLAVGSDSAFMQVINLSNNRITKITGHRSFVNDIKFLPNDEGFVSASADKTLRLTNQKTGTSELLTTLPFDLKKIDISKDSKWLVGASSKGQVIRLDLATKVYEVISDEAPNRVLSIALNPSNTLIAYGVELMDAKSATIGGRVKIYDFTQQKVIKQLTGHKSGISDLEFSPDGLLLASAGLDKKLQMWVVEHPDDLPIEMANNNGNIWDIAFTKDNNYLVASCNSGEIRVWPTDPKALAELVCPKLTRNMTREEWSLYVEKGKDPEITCKSVVIEKF
ncbi:MAG: High-affnity carbon uptake protein Hat/HatR [Bacteroidota bacterium]